MHVSTIGFKEKYYLQFLEKQIQQLGLIQS